MNTKHGKTLKGVTLQPNIGKVKQLQMGSVYYENHFFFGLFEVSFLVDLVFLLDNVARPILLSTPSMTGGKSSSITFLKYFACKPSLMSKPRINLRQLS